MSAPTGALHASKDFEFYASIGADTTLAEVCRGIMCQGAGLLALEKLDDTTAHTQINPVVTGFEYEVQTKKILAATTATNIFVRY